MTTALANSLTYYPGFTRAELHESMIFFFFLKNLFQHWLYCTPKGLSLSLKLFLLDRSLMWSGVGCVFVFWKQRSFD